MYNCIRLKHRKLCLHPSVHNSSHQKNINSLPSEDSREPAYNYENGLLQEKTYIHPIFIYKLYLIATTLMKESSF